MEYLRCTRRCSAVLVLFLNDAVRLDLTSSSWTCMREDAGPATSCGGVVSKAKYLDERFGGAASERLFFCFAPGTAEAGTHLPCRYGVESLLTLFNPSVCMCIAHALANGSWRKVRTTDYGLRTLAPSHQHQVPLSSVADQPLVGAAGFRPHRPDLT